MATTITRGIDIGKLDTVLFSDGDRDAEQFGQRAIVDWKFWLISFYIYIYIYQRPTTKVHKIQNTPEQSMNS